MNEELLKALYEKLNLSSKGTFDQFKADIQDPALQQAVFDKLELNKHGKFEDFQKDLGGGMSPRELDDARRLRENPNVLNTDQRITSPAATVSDASVERPSSTPSGGSISDMVNTVTQNAPQGDINRDVGVPQYNPAEVMRPMTDEEFAAEAIDNPMGASAVGALDALSSAPLRWAQGVITGIEDAAKNMMESYAAVKDVTTGGGGRNREIALRTGRDLTEMSNNLKDGVDAMRILTEEERQSIAENAAELNLIDGIGKKDMRAIPILLSQLTGDILVSRGTGTLGPVSYGLQAYGDADRELRNIEKTQGITISDDVKSGYKLGMGSAVGILDRFGAEGIVNKAVLKGLQQKIVTESLKEAAKKGARMSAGEFLEIVTTKSNSVGQLLKSGGVNALKGAGYEGGSEAVEQGLTDAIKIVSNREEGKELFNADEMKKTAVERYVNAFAGGAVGGGLLSGALGFSGTGNYVINEMAKAETKEQADAVIADVLGSIASSGAAPETVEMMRESLEDLAQAAMMLPKATTSEQRLKMLGLIQERREQDDAIKKAEQAVKDADEVFQDDEKLNVERLQARRKFINNEIKETAYGEKYKYTSEDGNYYQQLGNKPKELISQLEYEEMTAYREMEDMWKPIVMDDTVSDAVFEETTEGVNEGENVNNEGVFPAETEATVTQTIEPVQEYAEAETGSRVDTPISDMIGQPIVVENHKGDKTGVVALEDGEYVINMSDGVSYLLGTEFGVADVALSDAVPELVVRTEVPVSINEDWTVEARGTTYVNLYSDPLAAINRDEQGGVVSVTLDTQDGKKRTFRGQIAQDIAYQMLLKEFTNNEQEQQEFESFLESERSNDVVAESTVEQAPRVVEQVQPTTRTEQPTATGTVATTTPRATPTPRGNTSAGTGRNANTSGVTSSGEFEKGGTYTRTLSSGKQATYTLQDIVQEEDGTLFMFQRENSPYAIPIKSTDTEFLNSFDGIGVNIQQSEESNVLQTIIKEGINEADKFRKGQVVYDRFTPQEQRGISEGGEHHVNATAILSANARANTEESAPNEEQEALLEQYARDRGIWMEDTNAALTEQYGDMVGSGEESVVYPDGTSVIKSQNTNLYDDLQAKVDSITLHNSLFAPETGLEVIGFGRNADGDFQIVVRQPYIQGTRPTRGELDGHVESLGFKKVPNEANEYRTSDTIIDDLHLGNAIKTPAGNIAIIDPVMRLNTPAQGVGGKRTDTNNISVPNPSRNVTEATTVTTTLPNGKEPRTFVKEGNDWYVAKADGTPSKTKVAEKHVEFLNNKINNNEQATETTDEGVRMRETEATSTSELEETPAEETPQSTKKEAATDAERDKAKARRVAAKAKLQGALKGDTDARASLDIDLSDLSGVAALRSNSEAMAALQELVESGVELGKYNISDFLADLEDVGISVKRIYAADILQQLKENIGATTSQTDAAFYINPTGEPALAALIDKYAQERDGYKTRARKALRHIYALESAADKYTDDEMYDVLKAKYPNLIEGLSKNDFRVVASQPLQPATEQGTVFTFDGNDYMYDGQVWRTLDGKRVGSEIDIAFYSAMFGTAEAVENDALKIMVLTKGNTLNDILAAAPDLATIIPKKQLAELYKRVSAMSKEQRALQFNYAIPSAGTINVNNREYVIGAKGDITAKDGKNVTPAEKSAVIRESLVDQVEQYDDMQMNRRKELFLGRSVVTEAEAAPPLDINNYVPTTAKQKVFVESIKDVTEQMSRTGIHVSQVVHKSTAAFNSFVIGAKKSKYVGGKAIIIFRKGKGMEIHYNADMADATTPYHENAHAVLYTLFERTGYTTEQVEVVMDTLSVEIAKAFKGNDKNGSIISDIVKFSQNPIYVAEKTDTLEFTTEMLGRLLKGDIVVNRGFWAAEAGKAVWRGMKKVFHKLFSAMGMNTFADKVFGEKFSISNANDVGRLFNSIARAMKGETSAIDITKSQFDGKYVKFNNKPSTFVIEEDNARAQAGDKLPAPNGKPSNLTPEQYAQVRSKEFKAWFGDWENDAANASKVLDANGEPLVVYHGTTKGDFSEFKPNSNIGGVIFFSEVEKGAEPFTMYGVKGSKMYSAFLNIRNPLNPEKIHKSTDEIDVANKAKKKGADGFRVADFSMYSGFAEAGWAIFEPNQIKSATGNSGEFDATNPNIYAQLDENATPDDIAFVDMTEADKKIYDDVKDIIKTFGNEYTALNIVNTLNSYAGSTSIDPRVIYKAYTDAKREAMDKAEATEAEQGTGGLLTSQGVSDYINEARSIVTRKSRQQSMAEAIAKGYTTFESLRPIINRNKTNKAGYNRMAFNDVEQAGIMMVMAKNDSELRDLYDQRLKGAGAASSYVETRIAYLTDQNQTLTEVFRDGGSVAARVLAYRARRFTIDTFDANAIINMLQQHRNGIEAMYPGVVMPKINSATKKKIEDIASKGADFAKSLAYAEEQVDKQVIERWKEHAKSGIENISEGSADKGAAQMGDVDVKNRDVQLTRAIFVAATKYIDGYAADITKDGEKKINPATEKALEAAKEVKMPDGTTLYDMMMAKGKALEGESKEVGAIRWLRGLNDAVISKATTNQAMYNIAKKNKTEILGYVTPTPVQVTNAVNTALKEEFDVITINQALARASSLSIKNERDRLIQDKTNLALQNKSIRRFNTVLKQLEEDIADGAAYTDANLTALKESINTALTSMLDGVENANFPPKTMTAVQNYISDIMNAFTASAVRGNMVVTDAVGLSKAMYGIMAELEAGKMDSMVAQNAADIRALKNGDLEAISRISVAHNNMPTNSLILQKRAELQHSQQELQKEIQRTKIELNLAAMSSGEKFWYKTKRNLYTAFEGTRTINFMGDISALFIQARMATLGMIGKAPLRLAKLVYDVARSKEIQDDPFQWKALIADPIRMARHAWRTNTYTHAEANYEAMTEHPLHHYREQSGLAITRPGDMYATEEQFANDLFEGKYSKWGVRGVLSRMKKASEVHMSTMLNNARVAMFDSFVEANPEASPEEMRAIAKMINTQTGRTEVKGDTKKGIMKALSFALAAPRLYLSDIKEPFEATALLLGPNTPRSVRRHVAASYFTSAVGYSMIFAAAAFFTALYNAAADDDEEVWIETDADKPGFLQIHVGKVAIAPGSRIGRTMFFMKKLGRVAFDMPSDKVSDRRRQTEQLMDVMFREYKYKIHPFPSAGSRVWFGTDFMGKPLHPNRWVSRALATTAFLPIIGQQVSEPFKDMMVGTEEWNVGEILSSTAVAAPNLLGINSRDFSDNMGLHPESTKKLDIIGKAVYDGYVKKGVPAIAEGKKYAARFYKTDLNNRTAHHIGLLLTDYDREDIESMSQTERDMLWKDIKNTAQNNALAEFQEIWADAIAYFEPEVDAEE